MGLKKRLEALVQTVLDEAARNAEFRHSLERALGENPSERGRINESAHSRKGGRRTRAAFDPVEVVRNGEAALRERLDVLDIEQLRDVVAQFGMDPGKLVMKWKDRTRVIDRITEVALGRSTKGDAFRA